MRTVGRIRHKAYLRLAIADVAAGAESLGEIDLAHLCRKFGLVLPSRQSRRKDASGRWRYLDSEWDLPNGEVVVLEIDGRHHLEVAHWQADIKRERAVVITRRWVLRATVFEIRLEVAAVFSDLRAMGVPTLDKSVLRESVVGARGWRRGRSGRVSSRRYARWGRAA